MTKTGETLEFKYNADGLRVEKIATSSGTTKYTLHGKNIVHMTNGNNVLHFWYDAQNRPAIVEYNGSKYAYVYNLQGDVMSIIDTTGTAVVYYKYDAWGKPISKTGTMAATLGTLNPFRYRGYVFDEETGLYYLRSRYYRPEWCGFISADALIKGNLYCYCKGDPVNLIDPNGKTELGYTAWQYWSENAPYLASADGPYPIFDAIALGGLVLVGGAYVIDGVVSLANYFTRQEEKAAEKAQASTIEKTKHQAVFPENPNNFLPHGLIRRDFPGSSNGRFIKWFDLSNTMIFEWDEDHAYGSHYHIGEPHNGIHYYPGMPVPEPYNTLFFGE